MESILYREESIQGHDLMAENQEKELILDSQEWELTHPWTDPLTDR